MTFHFVYIHICKNKINMKLIHCFIDATFRFHLAPVQKDDVVFCPGSQIIPVFWPSIPLSPSFPCFLILMVGGDELPLNKAPMSDPGWPEIEWYQKTRVESENYFNRELVISVQIEIYVFNPVYIHI